MLVDDTLLSGFFVFLPTSIIKKSNILLITKLTCSYTEEDKEKKKYRI